MPTRIRRTSTDYRHPYRPGPVKLLNRFLRSADLSMERLLADACRKEKRDDFGDPSFEAPLARLLDAIENEAALTPFGRIATRARLVNILRNRLRAERLFRETPEILETPLPPVLLITGLQRTGTTLLHRLLAADPDTRSLAAWEALNPAPFPLPTHKDRAARIRTAVRSQKILARLAPDFFAIHPAHAESPEEDVLLLDYAFVSTVPESILEVPSYATWVEAADHRPAYRYMKKLLQLLHHQTPKKRWILKSPHHLEFLDTFFETFPDAKVVHTHRDPLVTLPSFCSMICHSRGIFSDRVDPERVGAHWLRKTARMLDRGRRFSAGLPAGCQLDIEYEAFIQDPMADVRRIYEMLDVPLREGVVADMEAVRQSNPQHRFGVHVYDMADFGLTEEAIVSAYEPEAVSSKQEVCRS